MVNSIAPAPWEQSWRDELQALVNAWAQLARPEQQAPNTYGDIINSLRGNRVAAYYQRMVDSGMNPAQARAIITRAANLIAPPQPPPGMPVGPGFVPPSQMPTAPSYKARPLPAPPAEYPVGPGFVPPSRMPTAPPYSPPTRVPGPPGDIIPPGGVVGGPETSATRLARLRQILGMGSATAGIMSKLRG